MNKNGSEVASSNVADFFIDTNQREKAQHGSFDFPCTSYLDEYYNSFYPWHWHDEIEFAYVEKGCVKVSINSQAYWLNEGEGILINSGVLHSYAEEDSSLSILPNILFSPTLLYGNLESIYWNKYVKPLLNSVDFSYLILKNSVFWQDKILCNLKKTFEVLNKKSIGYELLTRNYLSEILLLLHEHIVIDFDEVDTKKDHFQMNRLRVMVHFIQNNYTQKIEVKDIAGAASISVRECLRCFKAIINISPKQYVIELRIRHAKNLLLNSKLSLMAVCEESGFQDQSYFTKIFREKVGSSPGKWRDDALNI